MDNMYANFIWILCAVFCLGGGCLKNEDTNTDPQKGQTDFKTMRDQMVKNQIENRGVRDESVLAAMRKVPRHKFVPENLQYSAYDDTPLPIGEGQTISQPYIVGLMTECLKLQSDDTVLEIGTGSGYQAAVLAEIAKQIYSIEIVQPLCEEARARLRELGYDNIKIMCGDGYQGWPEYAPFDGIIDTAAPDHIPQPLIDQLKPDGRMIIPVGDWFQELMLIKKSRDGKVKKETVIPVRFVPMTGEAHKKHKMK